MKADDFAELVRKGDARLRADKVVVTMGKTHFNGSGVLLATMKGLRLDVTLSAKSKTPDEKRSVWNDADFWRLRGVIENHLPFTATHVAPAKQSSLNGVNSVSLSFHAIELTSKRLNTKERKALLLRFEKARKAIVEAGASEPEATSSIRPRRRKIALARFAAVLVNSELLSANTVTHKLHRNSFLGKTTGWYADTFVEKGRDYDIALIKKDTDLHVHFRSRGRYKSKNAAEDRRRFQAVLDAIGFTHGFNPWPYRLQQWRDGREEMDRITAPRRLPKTAHAPFDKTLGASGTPPPIQLVARFFERRSALSHKIGEFLFLFRQAGNESVHLPVTTLAFCSLFEGLVHLLFRELRLESRLRKSNPDFDAFLTERNRLVAELEKKGKAGEAVSQRLAGLLAHAEAVRVKDKFKALCEEFGLDYGNMKPHFDAWYAERNLLMHGTWKEHEDKDFVHQARIAGAISILLLKLMGYVGKVVAVRFGEVPSETYRTI